jgi:hypothetical protein
MRAYSDGQDSTAVNWADLNGARRKVVEGVNEDGQIRGGYEFGEFGFSWCSPGRPDAPR